MKCYSEHVDDKKIGRKRYLIDEFRMAEIVQAARRDYGNGLRSRRRKFEGENEMKDEPMMKDREMAEEERDGREMEMESE